MWCLVVVVFDAATETSSSSTSDTTLINWMGSREIANACLIELTATTSPSHTVKSLPE